MEIYNSLPVELKTKVFLYLEHPVAGVFKKVHPLTRIFKHNIYVGESVEDDYNGNMIPAGRFIAHKIINTYNGSVSHDRDHTRKPNQQIEPISSCGSYTIFILSLLMLFRIFKQYI